MLLVCTSNGRFVSIVEYDIIEQGYGAFDVKQIKDAVQNLCEEVLHLKDRLLRLSRNTCNPVPGYHARIGMTESQWS